MTALLSSCGNMKKATDLSDAAIVNFHRQFNESKFKELYAAASPDLKAVTTEANFIKLLESVQKKLGKQVSSSTEGSNINFSGKTVASISQNTKFEHGKAVETFKYVLSGDDCTLQGYNINSNDLIVK